MLRLTRTRSLTLMLLLQALAVAAVLVVASSALAIPIDGGGEFEEPVQEGAAFSYPPGPDGAWIDGPVKYQNGQSCFSYGAMVASSVGYARDPSRGTGLPAVNETFWLRLSVWVTGNPCAGGIPVGAKLALPPNTQLAVDAGHRVSCLKRLYRNGAWSAWQNMIAADCPQSWPLTTVLPSHGQYEYVLPVKASAALGGISQNHKAQVTLSTPTDASFGMNPVQVSPEVYVSTRSATGGTTGGTTSTSYNTGPPVNLTRPTITAYRLGGAESSNTHSCREGAWTNKGFSMNDPHITSRLYEWFLADDSGVLERVYWSRIDSVHLMPWWIGKRLRCRVTFTNWWGSDTAESAEILLTP